VKTGIHNFNNHNKFKKYWIPAGVYPVLDTGQE